MWYFRSMDQGGDVEKPPSGSFRILAREAGHENLQLLFDRGILSSEARDRAVGLAIPDPAAWVLWADRILLCIASALLLAGVIFFFAFNWDRLGAFAKLGLIEIPLVLCLVFACRKGLDSLPGQILLLSGSILTGVFLAVLGQIYQTGADAWQLFAAWFFLILGWTAGSRMPAQWFLQMLLFNLMGYFFGMQELVPTRGFQETTVALIMGIANSVFLAAQEVSIRAGLSWCDADWVRSILLLAAISPLTILAIMCFGPGWAHVIGPSVLTGALFYLLAMGIGLWFYGHASIRVGCVAAQLLSLIFVIMAFALNFFTSHDAGVFFFMLILAIFLFGGAGTILLNLSKNASVRGQEP